MKKREDTCSVDDPMINGGMPLASHCLIANRIINDHTKAPFAPMEVGF